MKQNFNNAGFSNVQANVLNLSSAVRLIVTNYIRTNLDGWMLDTFEMSTDQQVQLESLSPTFKQQIADAVADSWDSGQLVLFDKQVQESSMQNLSEKSPKDVLIEKMSATSQNVQSQDISENQQVSIRIQYR
ncbi:MAG: hypothetical protein LBE37_16310 [Sphingobacterium sp.]|jgi:hypothetical protein|nr:hypothetical protein [Sphingobacterium sp.]